MNEDYNEKTINERTSKKRARNIIIMLAVLVLIIGTIIFGIKELKTYNAEKEDYNAAVSYNSIDSLKALLVKYPKGYFADKIHEQITIKRFRIIKKTGSYNSIKSFVENNPDEFIVTDANVWLDSVYIAFRQDTALNKDLSVLKEALSKNRINEACILANDIYDSTPEISSGFDFLRTQICDTLCNSFANVSSLHHLYIVAVKYKRYELAKACLLRAAIEISPYYCGEITLMVYKQMQQIFGDISTINTENCERSIDLKDKIVKQIKQLNKEEFVFNLTDIFLGKNSPELMADYDERDYDLTDTEKLFIRRAFIASLDENVSDELTGDIYNFYSHPSVIASVVDKSDKYINYKLTNLTNSMQKELRRPLLSIIDTGSTAQRINAIIALGWIQLDDTTKQFLDNLYAHTGTLFEDQIVEKMAIVFTLEKTGIRDSLDYLIKTAKSEHYEIAMNALSLLRYTRNKIPSSSMIEIIEHISNPGFINPDTKNEDNSILKAKGLNDKYKILAEVTENSEYSQETGNIIFKCACQPYDGGEGMKIRAQWTETAKSFGDEITELAQSKLLSKNILESKLAFQIFLSNEKDGDHLFLESKFENDILPRWEKNKYSFFRPFVKKEAKSEFEEKEKTTFYPYYINYSRAYELLIQSYYKNTVDVAWMNYYLTFGIKGNKIAKLRDFDNKLLVTLLSMSDSTSQFINVVRNHYNSTTRQHLKICYAALLANNDDLGPLKFLLELSANYDYDKDIAIYLSSINFTKRQLELLEDKYRALSNEITRMENIHQKENEKEKDFLQRKKQLFFNTYFIHFQLTSLLAKHTAFKQNIKSELQATHEK